MTQLWTTAPHDQPAGLAAWATSILSGAGLKGDGLYVATATAGGEESVSFFREGLATGLAFANPRQFPWTLANSATGAIALALDIRGPTYTLLGGSTAVEAAFEQAGDDIADGLVDTALVVAVDTYASGLEVAAATVSGGSAPVIPSCPGAAAALRRFLCDPTYRDIR